MSKNNGKKPEAINLFGMAYQVLPSNEKEALRNSENWAGSCACGIYGDRPEYCKLYPFADNIMPGCGVRFDIDEEKRKIVRKGGCRQCGQCCAMPRVNGEPMGAYHPQGKPCKHLKIILKPIEDDNAKDTEAPA